jgi:amino acid transporter
MSEHHSTSAADVKPESRFGRIRRLVIGGRRNPFDPHVFHSISLITFFAWVGLGADGISSANYGPEEAYRAMSGLIFLAPVIAAVIAATVLIISAGYSELIEQFPSGGGGYLVASKLVHPNAGVVAGSALIVDYVLTIAVSIVSGVDAVFSMFPAEWASLKVSVAIFAVILLVVLNLRGVKESVMVLLPIFLVFVITHMVMVSYGFITHLHDLPARAAAATNNAHEAITRNGLWFIVVRFLTAFSMGAGTLTGIEAVSNGMLSLKEPRVQTGKRTMFLMAISLAFLAAMILIDYFLFDVQFVKDRTLNATLFNTITASWKIGALHVGDWLVAVMLVSAGLLLFVAAQTGFIGGPRVLANMAEDSWLPHRFGHLSERLVTQNGVIIMGAASILFILYAHGNTSVLVAIYSVNVFVGFSLALLGMTRLWWGRRSTHKEWRKKFLVSLAGFLLSSLMLIIMIGIKFTKGAWLTLFVTAGLVALCFYIHRHYQAVKLRVAKIDEILSTLSFGDEPVQKQKLDPHEPTAVILVEKYNGVGIHVLLNVQRLFGPRFKQYVFVSVGAIDAGHFKGVDELAELNAAIQRETDRYVTLARSYGLKAEARVACEIDYLAEIERICLQVYEEYPNSVFFAARLLFWRDSIWSRILHNETPLTIQRRLMFHGLQFVVLPVRLQ